MWLKLTKMTEFMFLHIDRTEAMQKKPQLFVQILTNLSVPEAVKKFFFLNNAICYHIKLIVRNVNTSSTFNS